MNHLLRMGCLALLVGAVSTQTQARHVLPPTLDGKNLAIYATPWHMVDDILNKQPHSRVGWGLSGWKNRLTHLAVSAVPKLGIMLLNQLSPPGWYGGRYTSKTREALDSIGTQVALGALAAYCYNWYRRSNLLDYEEQERIEQVMSEWPELRPYFPQELYRAFDAVYQLREETSSEYGINATKALLLAQKLAKVRVAEHSKK